MNLVCLTELVVCTWNPFECFRDFELLSLTFGCFRAPTIANPTGKGEACPSKSNIEDLPSLLTFLLPPGHCPSAPLGLPSFTCPLRGPQRTTLCLDEIVHTAWNRSISAPSFMDLKSVPQGTLSLGLLQGRPKKLRSLWDYWTHKLEHHSQPGARDLRSASRTQSSLYKWHLQEAAWDEIPQEKSKETNTQSPREHRHFRGR